VSASLVVCDFDGTLVALDVDWGGVRAQLADAAARVGVTAPARGVSALLAAIDEACPTEGERCRHLGAAAESAAARRGSRNLGLLDALAGASVAILTNNSRAAVQAALPRLGLRPLAIVGREDAPPKPDAAGLRLLLERCDSAANAALLVGDAPADFAAAAAAGVRAMHVRDVGERWAA
jgi:HAD superfamily hydrolase (TIGR01509 family)